MLPDFNRLRVFYHVYRQQSSTEAARVLHITQSGVSQQLKKLEEEVGCPLFTRMNRRLIPTPAGNRLFKVVEKFVDELEQGIRELQRGQEYPTGLLRIGAPEEFGKRYLPQIMASFGQKFPDVSFQLELGGPVHLLERMASGGLDLVYGDILPIRLNSPGVADTIERTPLVREQFVLACSRDYRERMQVQPEYEQLCKLDYIGYKKDIALFRSWFDLNFGKSPDNLNLVLVADSAETIIQGLVNDMGLAILVSHFIASHLKSGRLVLLEPGNVRLENTIASLRNRRRLPTVTEASFHHHLVKSLQKINGLDLYPENVVEQGVKR